MTTLKQIFYAVLAGCVGIVIIPVGISQATHGCNFQAKGAPQISDNQISETETFVAVQEFMINNCSDSDINEMVGKHGFGVAVHTSVPPLFGVPDSKATIVKETLKNRQDVGPPSGPISYARAKTNSNNLHDWSVYAELKVYDPFVAASTAKELLVFPIHQTVDHSTGAFKYRSFTNSTKIVRDDKPATPAPPPGNNQECKLTAVVINSSGKEIANNLIPLADATKYGVQVRMSPNCPTSGQKPEVTTQTKKNGVLQGEKLFKNFYFDTGQPKGESKNFMFGQPGEDSSYLYIISSSTNPNTADRFTSKDKYPYYQTVDVEVKFSSTAPPPPEEGNVPLPTRQPNFGGNTRIGDVPDYDKAVGHFDNLISIKSIPELIARLIQILLTLIAMIAVIVIIISGFKMVMYGGNPTDLAKAKSGVIWAILGLVVALISFSVVAIVQRLIQG